MGRRPLRSTGAAASKPPSSFRHQNRRPWPDLRLLCQSVLALLIAVAIVLNVVQFQNQFLHFDPIQTFSSDHNGPPVHVLFGLAGNDEGFFAEFEVTLKSVLLNGPHHAPLEVHIMADEEAHQKLISDCWPSFFQELPHETTEEVLTYRDPYSNNQEKTATRTTTIASHLWFTPVTITTYNVEPYLQSWLEQIKRQSKFNADLGLHTLGAYFRLMCYHVLPPRVERIFYLDTDVVIMANLAQVVEQAPRDEEWFFQWSIGCSGVMLINVPRLPLFWDYVAQVDYAGQPLASADQDLILGVLWKFTNSTDKAIYTDKTTQYSDLVRALPKAWDLYVSRDYKNIAPQSLFQYRPQIGAIHYNGGSSSKQAYFRESDFVVGREAQGGWPIAAAFYRDLPWSWLLFTGQSMGAGGQRYPIQISDYRAK